MRIEVEEINLEDLIVLGEDKLTPITVEFPKDGRLLKAKALIKQLTLKEVKNIDLQPSNPLVASVDILELALYKSNREQYSLDEILDLPVGVVTAISEKILEISGVNMDDTLKHF